MYIKISIVGGVTYLIAVIKLREIKSVKFAFNISLI